MAPVVKLKPTPIPRLEFRAGILQDWLVNADIPPNIVRMAVDGYMAGDFHAVTVYATNQANEPQEHATLEFSKVFHRDAVHIQMSEGQSLIDACSARFGAAVLASLRRMKVKGYQLHWYFHIPFNPGAGSDAAVTRKYGLGNEPAPQYASGHGPKLLFSVSPGIDPGVTYSHYTAATLR